MGNTGRSSTGCARCKQRKVKCDEGRPGCRKCALLRKPCPGYPYQVQLQFRAPPKGEPSTSPGDQPAGPSIFPIRPTVARETPFPLVTPEVKIEDDTSKSALQKLPPTQRSISPPLRYDIQHQSLCFFLNLFCFQAGRLYSFPVLDFLPGMLQSADPRSCIHKAAMAVSRMTLADRYSGKDVRLQTGREYGHALSLTNATIRDTAASIQDETVLSVWLLGLYEMISVVLMHGRKTPESRSLEEEWQSHLLHVRGAMNLLRLRGMSQFTTARGEKIFRLFKAAIQMRLFILNSVTSKDFDNLEIDVYQDEHEFVPSQTANKATAYFHRVARLLEKIKHFLGRSAAQLALSNATADVFLKYGETLDESMSDWSKDEPGWDMMRVRASTAGTMWALYPSHALHHFYSFWVFLYWLRFLTARYKLYEALIELLKLRLKSLPNDPQTSSAASNLQISKYRAIIQMTASELIGLTAYALGDVTPTGDFHSSVSGHHPRKGFQEINVVAAMQLVLPLKMLQRSEHLTATQKGAVDLAISHIGDGFRRQPLMLI
ncbi:hypothetical protein, variant [Cladophialophora immunda]|uniref:Zn(2)-C6 fungal-type domain-containing protein n=1 Tax=Cladophialophora immunda TaxID=569365 RepID=A0A0D1ZV83_9EURO|nr:uncharacterized protein PV07_03584 [Cladophialophora immunda]XP_016252218.1 hypothetical protein, variant [Cladophialophora immunda]KIW32001.1 hypothetical protein PV07_03584 [Cladophialophora immunda]KIW32002.1 hypothetical protein, variant [Cladophialophora immunda]